MTLGRVHRWSLFGACALAAVGTMSGSTLLAAAAGLLVLAMLATMSQLHDPQRGPLRTWIVHGLTVAVLVWALAIAGRVRIDSVVIVVLLGLFNRYVLRQGLRDDLILLGGAAVLLAVSTTITPGLAFLPTFIGFVVLTYAALRSSQIIGIAEREPEHRRAMVRKALLRRRAPGGLARVAATAMLFILVGYVGLTLFPKHRFARLLGAGAFMTLPGATDRMTLTNNGVGAGTNGTVVMRVSRQSGSDGPLTKLYAKVYSLDVFDGREWRRDSPPGLFPLFEPGRRPPNASSRQRVDVVLHRITRSRGPHPLVAVGRDRPARLLEVEARARTSIDGTWQIGLASSALTLEYGFDLGAPAPPVRLPASAERALKNRWLKLPERLDPRVRALGQRLTDSATTAADKIRAVLGHFQTGYVYSVDPLPGQADDPLARFLFEARQGHCELYAGAVAALLRVAGVPSRVVTGYYGGWWNSTAQTLEFTEQDAHAWVEVYLPDEGWVWVDATPPGERARRRSKALAWLRDVYDALDALWFNHVVDFDEKKRRALVERLIPSDWFSADGEVGPAWSFGSGGQAPAAVQRSGLLLAVGGMVTMLLVWWRVGRRRSVGLGRRLRFALDRHADPSSPLGTLVAKVPRPAQVEARRVVAEYEAWRFGAEAEPNRPPSRLVNAVRQLERAVATARKAATSRT